MVRFIPSFDGDGPELEPRIAPGRIVPVETDPPTPPSPTEPDPGPLPDPDGPITYPPPPVGGPVGPAINPS